MQRVVGLSGISAGSVSASLDEWLDKNPDAQLINISSCGSRRDGVMLFALIAVPEGTRLYGARNKESEENPND